MATQQKGASLNPADFATGGAVPDGRYTIKAAQAVEFDYGGNASAVPALCIVMTDGVSDFTQHYSAGKLENLVPSDDGDEFVHPGGGDAKISKSSNLSSFIGAMVNAGFPPNELTSKVACFVGADIDIVNQAQQKRPGLKDQVEGKTIPLPVKYHGRAKAQVKGRPTPGASAKASSGRSTAPSTAATPASNGDLDADTIIRVQEALTAAKDNTLGLVKLKLAVWQAASKAKDGNATAYRTLITQDWLDANAEAGSWMVDGENITLAQ